MKPILIEYKGRLYSLVDLTEKPLKIELILKAIDEGKVPSYADVKESK